MSKGFCSWLTCAVGLIAGTLICGFAAGVWEPFVGCAIAFVGVVPFAVFMLSDREW